MDIGKNRSADHDPCDAPSLIYQLKESQFGELIHFMGRNDQNSYPDLIEALMRVTPSNEENKHDVRVQLRINKLTIYADDDGEIEFDVELESAYLALTLDGMEDVPGTRHGELVKKEPVTIDHKFSLETSRQADVSGKIEGTMAVQQTGVFTASGAATSSASGSAGIKVIETVVAQETTKLSSVVARGNLRWEIREPTVSGGSSPLNGNYLDNELLCKIEPVKGANRLAVQLAAFVRQRDIKLTAKNLTSSFLFRNRNQEKMMKALIGKALSHTKNNGGILTFSVSEVTLDE